MANMIDIVVYCTAFCTYTCYFSLGRLFHRNISLYHSVGFILPRSNAWRSRNWTKGILQSWGKEGQFNTVQLLLTTVACNALSTQIVQCKLTLQLATTVGYNTKKVVAFWKHVLKAYDNRKRQLHATVVSKSSTILCALLPLLFFWYWLLLVQFLIFKQPFEKQ